ncbi:LOW QUALITY PROTEIN: hypothetical protein BT93_G1665 [Corymbia citriodora subsp. variegata]|nr:LOW QUALITY PROTEIN: hypothetical protein BT93_G1665 [Corymbia citriodora subsp. variegata]
MESAAPPPLKLFLLSLSFLACIPAPSAAASRPVSSPAAELLLPEESLPTKSGYLRPASGSAIYYAFYEAQRPTTPLSQTPLLIWLQGGPGCSSMIGNFYELGPWRVSSVGHNAERLVVEPNPSSWKRLFGLLSLDNPIGVGFSITASPEEIPKDQFTVAKHLFAAITAFVKLDGVFKSRPIYVTGESYAGNGMRSWRRRIGNGLTDPATQVATHTANAYFSGLINKRQKSELEKAQGEAVKLTQMGNWSQATDARTRVLRLLQNMTGLATLYDFTRKVPYNTQRVTRLLQEPLVKRALKANESIAFDECSDAVGAALHEDVMKSVKYMVEHLVENSRVLLYQGHSDLRDGVVSTEAWVKTMKWEGIGEFLSAERKVWRVNGTLAGYVQKWGSLSHVVVLGAGHLVPTDQPLSSQAMIEDSVLEKGLVAGSKEDER